MQKEEEHEVSVKILISGKVYFPTPCSATGAGLHVVSALHSFPSSDVIHTSLL